jgi:hypothetical protein
MQFSRSWAVSSFLAAAVFAAACADEPSDPPPFSVEKRPGGGATDGKNETGTADSELNAKGSAAQSPPSSAPTATAAASAAPTASAPSTGAPGAGAAGGGPTYCEELGKCCDKLLLPDQVPCRTTVAVGESFGCIMALTTPQAELVCKAFGP